MRFLNGRSVNLTHKFLDEDGGTLSPSNVGVTAYDAEGATAFAAADLVGVDGLYSADAGLLEQGAYRVVWAGTGVSDVEYVEVVGAPLFTVPEARASDRELLSVEDYPPDEIRFYREVVEAEFQTITGRSFVPRTTRVEVETDGSDVVWTGLFDCAALVAVAGPDGALVASDYRLEANGLLNGVSGLPEGTVLTLTVDYGFRTPPLDAKRAGLIRLRYLLAAETSGVPDRATSFVAAEGGTYTLATPGRQGYKIGIPEVDAVLASYSYNVLNDVLAGG